jgi:ribonuclease E
MSRKMLIDAAHPEETRVVVVDNNRVEEFDFESASKRPIRGNIYLARVTRVEPSLQAAFVEYGGNKHGFLAFNEIHPDYYQIPHADRMALREQEDHLVEDAAPEASGDGDEESTVDEEDLVEEQARRRRNYLRKYKIQEVIKRRQVLLVQVAKEERGNKGAALTTYLSLAGRYCVLMPNTARGGGISRKITNMADRKRLKSAVSELELPAGMGLIIRTAGEARTKVEIKRDYDYLIRLWEDIRTTTLESSAPSLIYEEGNLVKRVIRDLYDKDIEEVLIEGEPAYKEAKAFMKMLMPSHAKKVQLYKDDTPLFLRHQVESQLEAIHSPTAQLKSGGYLVINPTEALVSIDVNSGKSTKERNIEQTATRTNLEAAEEAARQMRLRDLAGLLVIDFIDMDESKNVRAVEKKMKDSLRHDRARLQVGRISQFGLLEMSRQRRRTSLVEGSSDMCPHCQGAGYVRSLESSGLVALRTLEEEGVRGRTAHMKISCSPEVALYLLNEKREHLKAIEARYQMRVTVDASDTLVRPACEAERLESRKEAARADAEAFAASPAVRATHIQQPIEEPDIDEDDDETLDAPQPSSRAEPASEPRAQSSPETRSDDDDGDAEGGAKKRRRRGRRGGRNRRRRDDDRSETSASGEDGETSEGGAASGDASGVLAVVNPTGGDDFSTGDAPPKRTRPARGRKPDETPPQSGDDTAAATDTAPGAEDAPATAEADSGEAKPKTRRRRRKNTDPAPDADASAPGSQDAASQAEPTSPAPEAAQDEPKPRRRTRRKPAEPVAEDQATAPAAPSEGGDPVAETGRADTPEPVADAKPAKAQQPPETREPGEPEDDGSKPRKSGWWQRSSKFLGL